MLYACTCSCTHALSKPWTDATATIIKNKTFFGRKYLRFDHDLSDLSKMVNEDQHFTYSYGSFVAATIKCCCLVLVYFEQLVAI